MSRQLFVGPLIHSDVLGNLITLTDAAILVQGGKIINVIKNPKVKDIEADKVTVLKSGQFLVPGFVDGHVHAVQFPNLGLGYDKPLLDWLESYTFPLERKYGDNEFADRVFKKAVRQTINNGTTTACYFASLYKNVSTMLAREVVEVGQRALVGKVNMNTERGDGYYENTADSIANTKEFVNSIRGIGSRLVQPIITPRFALSCDMKLMKELGTFAKENNLHIQSHISENLDEVKAVKEVYKEYPSYAAVYDAAGLLTNKTVLAHGIYLSDSEIALLKARGTAIIHCPSSNTCLRSGLCDVQRLRNEGIKVGLGTDVAGGQSCSILDAMKSALQVSVHLSMLKPGYQPLHYKDVFHMATLGGATALAMDNETGNLVPGKEFDALVIDLNDDLSNFYTLEEKLQKFIYSGDDRNIAEVYVSGRKVK